MLTIEQINKLEQENAELKAELDTYKKIWSNPEVHVALVDVRTGERKLWYENCLKYKQTLQEIKEIAEENKDTAQYGGICKSILDLITKAEDV